MVDGNQKFILGAFVESLLNASSVNRSLLVGMASPESMCFSSATNVAKGRDWQQSVPPDKQYEFVVADLPLGLHRERVEIGDQQVNIRRNWAEIWKALQLLTEKGTLLALVEPPAFGISEGPKFEESLNRSGFFVNGIFNTPLGTLKTTSLQPIIVVLNRLQREEIFAAELEDVEQAQNVAVAFAANKPGGSLGGGVSIARGSFRGFASLRADRQLAKLETQFKEYDSFLLCDVAEEINAVRSGEQHIVKENSVYIPMIGTSSASHDLSAVTVKHHNLFQVVLSERADSEYLSAYFRSDLGRLVLSSLTYGAVIPKISKAAIRDAKVALPSIEEQREIAATHRQLSILSAAIDAFQSEMALNPRSAAAINGQLDTMLEQIGGLTDADKIMSLIRSGESRTIEFKETFSRDVRKGTKEKHIELSAIKTVVAFLNTNGGHLVIGISDSGEALGIDIEVDKFYKSRDKFLLHFKNQIKQRIGEQYYPFIDHRLVDVGGACVLLVDCGQASQPCYLDGKDFYVRTNPATDKLEGPKLVEYVQNHFVA